MQRKSEEERKMIVERYRENGLSVSAFCLQESIGEQTLRNWIRKLQNQQTTHQGFIEIPSGDTVSSNRKFEQSAVKQFALTRGVLLNFPDGVSIEVFPETDRDTVAWIVEMLRGHS